MKITLKKLQERDFSRLFEFETQNRLFFETKIPSRGDDYYEYETFLMKNKELLEEQHRGTSNFYLIKDHNGTILGRINLVGINEKIVDNVGYRIGQNYTRKGIANTALKMLLEEAVKAGILKIKAITTIDHIASQKVLEKNGFIRTVSGEDTENFVYYIWAQK